MEFSLRMESIGVVDPKEFNLGRHITKAVWQKGFKS